MSEQSRYATNSPRLNLPYVQAAQAQKHVTVNEALAILDDLHDLSVLTRNRNTPPSTPQEGDRYLIAASARAAWSTHSSKIAVYRDRSWFYYSPRTGLQLYVEDEAQALIYDGTTWQHAALIGSNNGARSVLAQSHADVTLTAGSHKVTRLIIPANSIAFAVSCLVKTAITGPTSFSVGVAGATNRYADNVPTQRNSRHPGVATPTPYYTATAIIITAKTSPFTAGSVSLTLHYLDITPPSLLP